jgi:hypothetical protein
VTGKKAADKERENEEVAEAVEEGVKVSEGGDEAVTEEQKEKEGEEGKGEEKDLTLSDPKVSRKSTVHPVDPVLDRALYDR